MAIQFHGLYISLINAFYSQSNRIGKLSSIFMWITNKAQAMGSTFGLSLLERELVASFTSRKFDKGQ